MEHYKPSSYWGTPYDYGTPHMAYIVGRGHLAGMRFVNAKVWSFEKHARSQGAKWMMSYNIPQYIHVYFHFMIPLLIWSHCIYRIVSPRWVFSIRFFYPKSRQYFVRIQSVCIGLVMIFPVTITINGGGCLYLIFNYIQEHIHYTSLYYITICIYIYIHTICI